MSTNVQTTTTRRQRHSELSDVVAAIIAIFLPPLGVFLEVGCHADFFINILLTILGWLPGVIHAFYIIFLKDNTRTVATTKTPVASAV